MGHSYDKQGRLCCDGCGNSGGVRARKCRYLISRDGYKLPYCYPPDLCAACFKKHGGTRGIHGDKCKEGAARMQAQEDARQARLQAGEWEVRSAFGSGGALISGWPEVPEDYTGVVFRNAKGEEVNALVPRDSYNPGTKRYLSDYPEAQRWHGAVLPATKQVSVSEFIDMIDPRLMQGGLL